VVLVDVDVAKVGAFPTGEPDHLAALYEVIVARGAEAAGAAAMVDDCPPDLAQNLRLRSLVTGADLVT
jgi:hypothetical protein